MKLISIASRYFLITCLIALVAGTFLGVVFLKKAILHEETEELIGQKNKIERFVKSHNQLPENELSLTDSLRFLAVSSPADFKMIDSRRFNNVENELLNYRELSFGVSIGNQQYKVSILRALYETDELTQAVVLVLISIILLTLITLFITNYLISKKLWQPFYQTLGTLENFKIAQPLSIDFEPTKILEFQNLQQDLTKLTEKVRRDYQSLKSFTENASHELQTPLSVIGSNLEMLIQADNLTENQLQQISQLIDSLGKVSRLNQTLLLLTKIENRQFDTTERINVSEFLKNKLVSFGAWISLKSIAIETNIQPDVKAKINSYLLEILLNNILGNAIKYNILNGILRIQLSNNELIVENSGVKPEYNPEEMFQRFRKGKANVNSLGLGLAIVKQICDTYGFEVSYNFRDSRHTIQITF